VKRRLPDAWLELIQRQLEGVTHPGQTVVTVEHGPHGGIVDVRVQPPPLRASMIDGARSS
jgi:hypothetical protein